MGVKLDPRHEAIREEVKAFAEKEIYPISDQLDRNEEGRKFPRELYRKIGQAGYIGYAMPKELGGSGKSHMEYAWALEELVYHDPGVKPDKKAEVSRFQERWISCNKDWINWFMVIRNQKAN